jgi:hypothetical protein
VRAVDVAGNWSDASSADLVVTSGGGGGGGNSVPTATAQAVTTPEDTSKGITLAGTDGDGDALTFDIVAGPAHGTLTGAGATQTYVPAGDFNGSDSFTFTATDGVDTSAPATVSITVSAVNDPPTVSAPASASTTEGTGVTVAAVAGDVDGDQITVTWTVTPGAAVDAGASCQQSQTSSAVTVTCDDDGTYTAVATADDGQGGTATASTMLTIGNADPHVSITIAPTLPALPGAVVDVVASVSDPGANDTTTCTIDWGDGTVSNGLPATPTCGASHAYTTKGVKHVVVTATDDDGGAGSADTTITVLDQAPTATQASLSTPEDTATAVTLSGSDPDNDPLTTLVLTTPTHGSLSGTGANRLYTPDANYNGADSFTFAVSDGTTTSAAATIDITVTAINDAPVANSIASISAVSGVATAVPLAGTDVEGDPLTIVVVTPPAHADAERFGLHVHELGGLFRDRFVGLRRVGRGRPIGAGHRRRRRRTAARLTAPHAERRRR